MNISLFKTCRIAFVFLLSITFLSVPDAMLAQSELPIDFSDPATDLAPFGNGGTTAMIGADPTDPTNEVLCIIKPPGEPCWAGVTIGGGCLTTPVDFSMGTVITLDVFSPAVGTPFLLKVEDCTNGGISTELIVLSTMANAWETLTFDFAMGCPGPPNPANTYNRLSVFPNFTCDPDACGAPNPGVGSAFTTDCIYIDDITFVPSMPMPTECTGMGDIPTPSDDLPNGYTYTIVEDGMGNVTITITVTDAPAGLVGFLNGPGGIFQVAAGNVFTWTEPIANVNSPINVFLNWAAGGAGNITPIAWTPGDCEEMMDDDCAALNPPIVMDATMCVGDPIPTLTATCDTGDCPSCAFDPATMEISVSFTGTHTFVSDLSFYLQGPSGCGTPLITFVPGTCCPNGGNDFNNFTFTNGAGGDFVYPGTPTPLTGTYNSSNGTLIDWSVLAGCDIYAGGWNVIIGDCVGGDIGTLDQVVVTISDNGNGGSCLAGLAPLVYDSGAGLNAPIDDNECIPGVDMPATFSVNIPEIVNWYDMPTGGTLQGTGDMFDPSGSMAEEGAFDPNTPGTYTYYVDCSCNGCVSDRAPVTITVEEKIIECPAPPTAVNQAILCLGDDVPVLEVECVEPNTFTFDPAAPWEGFMNVFDLQGNFVFPSGWGTTDLVALVNGDELCLQPNQITDPDPFWYIGGGGPGAPGNKLMDANYFVTDVSGALAGQTKTYTVEVTSEDFSCGHETNLFIREFLPDFSALVGEALVPISGPGIYTVSLPITPAGNPVQYGFNTFGVNVWPTDAPACGSVKIMPVQPPSVCWYSDATSTTPIGTGETFDPTGTTAEEGPFDPTVPGVYTYYATCKDESGCESERTPVTVTVVDLPEPPTVVTEPVICAGGGSGGGAGTPSPFCNASVFHFGGNPESEAIITVENSGPTSMTIILMSPDPTDPIDDVVIPGGSGATITEMVTGPNEYTVILDWPSGAPATVNLNILWSFQSFGGFWQLDMSNFDIPFDVTCNAGPLLEVSCEEEGTFTFDPAAPWEGFMNVFDLGGNFIFNSGWGTADLVALVTGDELCLQPNQITDADPFWYIGGGGPGAQGNKLMDANYFVTDFSGALAGQTKTYTVEVTSEDFSCGHETNLFIREFLPDFSALVGQALVPISGPGIYTVSLPITPAGNPIQYGFNTFGPNVWPTDAPACGSVKVIPAEPSVCWYSDATSTTPIGTGETFDPTGTMAEEGPFDPTVPGVYTYYASCKNAFGCEGERVPVTVTILGADAGTQSLEPIEVCTDVETSLTPAGMTGNVEVMFMNLPNEPTADYFGYAWVITDANGVILNVLPSTNYNSAMPANFADDILLRDMLNGQMLPIGQYCIHGLSYLDSTLPLNAGAMGAVDFATLQTLIGMNAVDVAALLSENDGVATAAGADGSFTFCADLNVAGCTPVIVNPTPEILASPTDSYTCAGDAATLTASAFVLPGDHLDPSPSTLIFTLEWSQDDGLTWTEFTGATADPAQPIVGPTGDETVTFTIPGVTGDMNCSLWRIVVTADHNPDPDCFNITETAKLFVHTGGAMSCNDRVNFSLDDNCEIVTAVNDFYEGDYDACGDDEIAYMNAFFRVEFETKEGAPVAADELGDQVGYGDGCLIYNVIDNCTGNSCWGEICIEDKSAPELECDCPPGSVTVNPDGSFTGPAQCIIECHDVERYLDGRRGTPDVIDNCDTDTDADFAGAQIDDVGECTYKITQVWSVTITNYQTGETETASCINEYYVDAPSLDDVECPDDVVYECDEVDSPHLTHPDETGYPTLWNQDIKSGNIDSYCNIFAAWDDVEIPACGPDCYGATKILRTWTILDWCTAEIATCNQVIKVIDSTDPTIIADDIVVSTDAWVCSADIWFDDPLMHDNCTYDLDYEIAWSNSGALLVDDEGRPITQNNHGLIQHAMGVPKGTWSFILRTNDCCGNAGYDTISVTVLDNVAPVAVATQNIVVSLTGAYPEATAKVLCESINNGSHDNCSGVWCEIRRDSDPCDIEGNLTYSNKIPEFCDPWYDDDDHDYGQHVKFCCEDAMADGDGDGEVDGMVKVWMRVWDDANMDGEHGSWTFYDNPGNQHDYCEFNDNYNETWVYVTVEDKSPQTLICPPDVTIPCHWDYNDLSLTGEAVASQSCGHPHVAKVDWPEIHCGEGYVLREWFVDSNNNGEMDSDEGEYPCVQRITIEYVDSPLEVVCPDFEDFEDVDGNPDILWFDPFNPNHLSVDCEDFEFPEPWQSGGKCNLIGVSSTVDTFWFEEDACFKAIKTWNYVDWCNDDSFTCDFVVSLVDTEPPTVTAQDTCYPVNDYWDADGDWNFCEMTSDVDVCAMGDDMGDCPSEWIKWVVEVDLWYDGNVDLSYSSFLPHSDDFYVAPTPRGEKVTIELDKDDITAEWARHFIEWKAFDGCGNVAQTHQYVEVADKKAPTPYCIGISTALMSPEAGNLVELWAIDFNLGSFDNCTTEDHLKYTFGGVPPVAEKLDEVHCFRPVWENEDLCAPMTDENGNIVSEEVNNCNGYENGATDPMCQIDGIQRWNPDTKSSGLKFVGTDWCGEWDIKVAVWDTKFNMDYCYVTLVVHGAECDGAAPRNISGTILTEAGEPVAQAEVTNTSSFITGGEMSMMTQEDGVYAFTSNIEGGDYAITSYRNNDFLNGVSTLDLVIIQKHILGVSAINSPYKIVASDINNDESVTAVDLVELRKLILGIYTELPANTSWRFVDAGQNLNVTSPWPLIETVNISNLVTDMMAEDFVGIKVGDVNENAISSANGTSIDTRSGTSLNIIKESLNGSVVFKAGNNFNNVFGYQFTMDVDGSVSGIMPGMLSVKDENFGFLNNGQVTTSFANEIAVNINEGDVLFTLVGIDDARIVNGYTRSEAYVGNDLSTINVELRDGLQEEVRYSLSQNEPNPFSTMTNVKFNLGKAGSIALTVFDVTGKTIKVINGQYEAGLHSIQISKKELGTSGIMYYKLESGDFTATKKMIIIE